MGGIFRHVRDLTDAQVAAGHDVGIVCDSTTGGDYEDRLFESLSGKLALGVRRTPMQRHIGPGDIAAAWRTFKLIKELQPDVLHGHGAKGGVYARLFGSLLRVSRSRVARLYTPHGGSLHYNERTLAGKFLFLVERVMAYLSDHILFVSGYERDAYRRKVGEPPSDSSLVYNGLRAEEFVPVMPKPDAADFLYIGMMRDLKGPDLFIDAIANASRRLERPLTAVMVGDGVDLPRYQAQVERLGLSDTITFHPAMPARAAFALARTVVVPSRAEAMPYIVLEALGAGRPMIASSVGGIPEIFGPRSPALIRPETGELADRMVQVINDEPAHAAAMPSTMDLKRRFGADVMARQVEQAYLSSLSPVS